MKVRFVEKKTEECVFDFKTFDAQRYSYRKIPPVIRSFSQRTFSKRLSDFGQPYCNILWALSETN
jgi:hypothetical protein